MKLSVVIPCYNAEETIGGVVERLVAVLDDLVGPGSYELLLVDDGSPSGATWPALRSLAERHDCVRSFQLSRNFGQQAATICGLEAARGAWILTMDDDGQHRPEDIPRLYARREHDIVIAQFPRRRSRLQDRVTSRIKAFFDRVILDVPKGLRMSSFRLLRRHVVDGALTVRTHNPFLPALLLQVSRDVVGVDVTHDRRQAGRSGYNFWRRARVFTNLLINNSSIPLQAISFLGFSMASVSVGAAAWVIVKRLTNAAVPIGWASVIVTTLFVGGALLVAIGVVGEYLHRLVMNIERPRSYHLRRRYPPAE